MAKKTKNSEPDILSKDYVIAKWEQEIATRKKIKKLVSTAQAKYEMTESIKLISDIIKDIKKINIAQLNQSNPRRHIA